MSTGCKQWCRFTSTLGIHQPPARVQYQPYTGLLSIYELMCHTMSIHGIAMPQTLQRHGKYANTRWVKYLLSAHASFHLPNLDVQQLDQVSFVQDIK